MSASACSPPRGPRGPCDMGSTIARRCDPLSLRQTLLGAPGLRCAATAPPGSWQNGRDGEPAGWPRPGSRLERGTGSRKVGTPQGRVLANGQSGRPAGQCHREQTADGGPQARTGKGETVRQERTSGPGDRTGSVNPTRSKAKRGTRAARPPREGQSPGRPRRWMATHASSRLDRIPPTGRLTVTSTWRGSRPRSACLVPFTPACHSAARRK